MHVLLPLRYRPMYPFMCPTAMQLYCPTGKVPFEMEETDMYKTASPVFPCDSWYTSALLSGTAEPFGKYHCVTPGAVLQAIWYIPLLSSSRSVLRRTLLEGMKDLIWPVLVTLYKATPPDREKNCNFKFKKQNYMRRGLEEYSYHWQSVHSLEILSYSHCHQSRYSCTLLHPSGLPQSQPIYCQTPFG